ncbi:MAG: ComF family protein [Usitatibacter sp.]
MGQDCALCGVRSDAHLICAACDASLPRSGPCCVRCAVPLATRGTCGACIQRRSAFDEVHAAFEYRFPVDRLVQRFKFDGDLAIGAWLAHRLGDRLAHAPLPDLLVVPPLSSAGLRKRGFNQAIEIARILSARLGPRLARGALAKVRDTGPQHALDARARRANLRGAFTCRVRLAGESVAIVDDVVTTGATAEVLADVLARAGAGRVSVWAVARTP